jgi:hypothetical protein
MNAGVNRVIRVLLALCAGAPYGPVLPVQPSILDYRDWFPRWTPKRAGP